MDEINHSITDIENDMYNVYINLKTLKENLNKNEKIIEKLSHIMDIKEIVWSLNDKILSLNDNIESDNIEISKNAIDRIENNKIVKKVMEPYIPFIILNLYKYNT